MSSRRHRISVVLIAILFLVALNAAPAVAVTLPEASACPVFPSTNVWNKLVDTSALRNG